MASFTAIDPRELEERLHQAGIAADGPMKLAGVPEGSVNSNYRLELPDASAPGGARRYFVRLYEEQDHEGAEREARLLRHLSSRGIPTPAPLSWSRAGAGGHAEPAVMISTLSGKPAAIFPWVEGEMRCQRGVTTACASYVGEALARVHRAGESLGVADYGEGRFRPADLRLRLPRIAAAEDAALSGLASSLARRLDACEARRDPDLPRGLVHGDLFRDNVLWSPDAGGGPIAALLDFESASDGVYVFDLAVTVLAWTYGDAFDHALARAMIEGYESVRPLSPGERGGFVAEATLAALRFTITRITDYAMPRGAADVHRVRKDWRRFDARARWLEAMAEKQTALPWF